MATESRTEKSRRFSLRSSSGVSLIEGAGLSDVMEEEEEEEDGELEIDPRGPDFI